MLLSTLCFCTRATLDASFCVRVLFLVIVEFATIQPLWRYFEGFWVSYMVDSLHRMLFHYVFSFLDNYVFRDVFPVCIPLIVLVQVIPILEFVLFFHRLYYETRDGKWVGLVGFDLVENGLNKNGLGFNLPIFYVDKYVLGVDVAI
ncbi:hypothetical protein K7X08_024467 [Anisodus acutangulus]|uniref:Uncharacterized protein n=1 Tax=Anisodus acutangulus TaxID=402998 RepID=A0A9Q1M7X7_9SOLA|nr:hypothetical protein K7X08_024467 [Anisodus acutangulus]